MYYRAFAFLFFSFYLASASMAGDSLFFKLHFVYGSKPKHGFKAMEPKYFGGIHGGHVYMEADGKLFSFGPDKGQWHVISHRKKIYGKYRVDSNLVWCGDTGKLQITTITIPITKQQLEQFQQLEKSYLQTAPYDYAFVGMRCAAAAYDVLSQIGISRKRSRAGIVTKNFYPKRLRVKLLKRARREHWIIEQQKGRPTRKWEKD
jgi:hypothetical protein